MSHMPASPLPSGTMLVVAVNWSHDEPLDAHRLNEAYARVDRARSRHPIDILTGGSLPRATTLTPSPNDDGWTILVAESRVTEAQQDWIRRHWREAEEEPGTYNRIFQMPPTEVATGTVDGLFLVKALARMHGTEQMLLLVRHLAEVVDTVSKIVGLCEAASPVVARNVMYANGPVGAWMIVLGSIPDAEPHILDRIVTRAYNELASPAQRARLLAFLEPA